MICGDLMFLFSSNFKEGDIAQLGERTTEVHQESHRAVPGSIPGGASLFDFLIPFHTLERQASQTRRGIRRKKNQTAWAAQGPALLIARKMSWHPVN